MKRVIGLLFCLMVILSFQFSAYAEDPDTLDVVPGYETLNLAVEGDTTATGEVKNPNRVYRLERNGYYLTNGQVFNLKDNHLRIVAAEGDGQMPILIPMVDETGKRKWGTFELYADGTFKGLFITSYNNLGNITKNMFRLEKAGGRFVIDRCFLEYEESAMFRSDGVDQTLIVTNTIMANRKRPFDFKASPQDTMFIQNCTFYRNYNFMWDQGGLIRNWIMDHNTLYQVCFEGENIEIGRTLNCTITNNLLIDFGFEGDIHSAGEPDSLWMPIVDIEPLGAPEFALDQDRVYKITNNVYGWTEPVQAWIDGIDSVYNYPFINSKGQQLIDTYPNMVFENNIVEVPTFSDVPDPAEMVPYAQHHLETNWSWVGDPDPIADRNGIGTLAADPASFGPAEDPYDFDYNTDALAYTHAEGGFPVGDLNWFPDKKTEWETWVDTGVENEQSSPKNFTLEQNFPNPFNPETTIHYRLNKTTNVSLIIYNALGQRVRSLVNGERQSSGQFSVQWDGRNDAGQEMASGVYCYRLEADSQIRSMKMLMIR